jgi:hypothetical protein
LKFLPENLPVPHNWNKTAPTLEEEKNFGKFPLTAQASNPQTTALLEIITSLQVELFFNQTGLVNKSNNNNDVVKNVSNPNEINIDDIEDE